MGDKITSLKINTKKATEDELNNIPVSSAFNYESLTTGNDDKIEVIAEIPVSTSKRDWDYTEEALKDVVNDVNAGKVVGFKGHQKPENISTEFPDVKTIWLGAKYDENRKVAVVRGLQDKHDTQLNYLVKNGIIDTVSIFGQPKLKKEKGRTKVIGYKTMSIDWTPRNRAGMPTTVKVASGEMEVFNDTFKGELDGSFEETKSTLDVAVRTYFGSTDNNNIYVWGKKTFPDYAVYQLDNNDKISLHKVYYEEKDDTISITSTEEVKLVESFVPVNGEMTNKEDNNKGGNDDMDEKFKEIIGEMTADDLKNILAEYDKLKDNEAKRLHGEMVKKCVDSKVENEKVKNTIMELYTFSGNTEDLINGEIDEILKKDTIKDMLNTEYKGVNENNNSNDGKKFKYAGLTR